MVFECSWKEGFRCSVKAQVAGEIMQRMADEDRLTPQELVDEARPESSPLHKGFEWDDAKAAENYRRQQATMMIRAIVVKESAVIDGGSEEIPVKVFNQTERGGTYESLRTILVDSYKVNGLLGKAKEELRVFRSKYRQLERLSKLMADIDEVLEEDDDGIAFGA